MGAFCDQDLRPIVSRSARCALTPVPAIALVRRGRRVCFYKRAQIFAADVWGAFGGQGAGAFSDIGALTMFADYRVPAQLRTMGLLEYSPELARRVRPRGDGRGQGYGGSWGGRWPAWQR